jgi:hypothetical protein
LDSVYRQGYSDESPRAFEHSMLMVCASKVIWLICNVNYLGQDHGRQKNGGVASISASENAFTDMLAGFHVRPTMIQLLRASIHEKSSGRNGQMAQIPKDAKSG